MVGSRFCELQKTFNLIKADLNGNPAVDVTNEDSISSLFQNYDFSTAILFSAYTDVEGAQKQKEQKGEIAWKINVDGAGSVAKHCREKGVKLIFISTDFVFDGKNGPYSEESRRSDDEKAISWYGYTKLKAEEIVESTRQDNIILRISFPYRGSFEGKDDFARSIIKKYDQKELHPMFSDQYFTPTFADDIAPAIELLISKNARGIFHLASPDVTTPYEFAKHLIETFGRDPADLKSSSIVDFQKGENVTPRPIKGGLKVDKIESLGFNPTGWQDGISKIFSQTGGKLI